MTPPPRPTPDIRSYLEIRSAGSGGIDPDGRHVLVSSDLTGTAQLYRLDLADVGTPAPLTDLTALTAEAEPVGGSWLPAPHPTTGDTLLVTRDAGGDEQHQLFTADHAEPGRGLAELVVAPGVIHRPGGVSRDGRLLAYATNARTGSDFDVRVRDLASGTDEMAWAPGGWAGAAGFSPRATWLTVWELTGRPGDNRTHLLHRPTGRLVEVDPHDDGDEASVGAPSWLPDESAFYVSSDVGRDKPRICRGTVRDGRVVLEPVIDPGWDCDCAVDWTGRWLTVVWNEAGLTRGRVHDAASLEVATDLPMAGVAGGVRIARDARRVTWSQSSATEPGSVMLHDLADGSTRRLTTPQCDVDPAGFVEPRHVTFPSFDGLDVPAFVYRPDASRTAATPVICLLHGGPESQYRPSFSPVVQYLVARGYAVVAPNIRGSTGYGKRYSHLDDVELRPDAFADLAAMHDWIAAADDLDADRAALWGGSYGGYLVLAGLATQPDRWAAGVDIVGMSSLVTFLRNTSSWRRAAREREYGSLTDDLELLEQLSPITHIDAIRAPLCIVHGRNDPRVPVSEAEQIHAALRSRGVRSDLIVYDDEGHGLARLDNRVDAYPRIVTFLDETLGDQAVGSGTPADGEAASG